MAAARVERRLAAILAADVVGYSRLMEADEAGTFARLKEPASRADRAGPAGAWRALRRPQGRRCDRRVHRASPAPSRRRWRSSGRCGTAIPTCPRTAASATGSASTSATSSSTATPSRATASTSRRGSRPCASRAASGSRAASTTRSRASSTSPSPPTGRHQVKNISEPVETFRVALDGVAPIARPASRANRRQRLGLAVAAPVHDRLPWRDLVALAGRSGECGAIDRGPAVRQSRWRRGDRPAGRGADRGHHHRPCPLPRPRRHRPQLDRRLPRHAGRHSQGRHRSRRRLRPGRLDPAPGRACARHRAAHRCAGRAHAWSPRWDRPAADVFAVQTEIAERVASTLGGYAAR